VAERNPNWTRGELIPASDLYMRRRPAALGNTSVGRLRALDDRLCKPRRTTTAKARTPTITAAMSTPSR
jgi:hypothetical protein